MSGILALCFWFSSFFLWKYFDANLTTRAQPGDGRIYPLNTHGSVVYLTFSEHYFLYGLIVVGVIFFLLAAAFYFISSKRG